VIELGLVDLRVESDVVRAHQTTRTIAAQLGFTTFEQTRIATAMSEIARNALTYASGGSVEFGLDDERQALKIVVLDHGPGIPELDQILSGERRSPTGLGIGIPGARRLMDDLAIETTATGTRVEMTKRVPRRRGGVDVRQIGAMRSQLAGQLADDPGQEIRRLQRDVAERDQRITDLANEIHETNRGVMALHTELEDRAAYQREAVELRTRLLREMGHEMRTPLHSIATISQFMIDRLDGPLTDEQDKQVHIIHEVTESLTAYVNDLLDLARTDAGRAIVHAKQFAAADTLKALRRILQPLVPVGVQLRFDVGELPDLITDEQKLSQILRNLVANAIKFTERGTIDVRANRAGPDNVQFEVRDTGQGIAAEHHELIFREFAQVDGEVQSRMRGSGLGLPLSRRLAELLGGTLTVSSEVGTGSSFLLDIPIECEASVIARVADDANPKLVPTRAAPGRRRVLVIDDDVASRYVLRRWLSDRYEVDEAASGGEGLRRAASQPDVIFLDVVIPDLTGFEVIEQLKANPETRDIPVVVYSALVLGSNDRARLAAATAILRKSTSSRVADRAAIEDALVKAGVAIPVENPHD
jgi:signal transduction histidine kinase